MRCLFRMGVVAVTLVAQAVAAPPVAERRPVVDSYHGVDVTDDYRWLEDWDDPEVKAWSSAQNKAAREHLDALPHAAEVRKQVTEILSAKTIGFGGLQYAGGQLFAFKRQPPKEQPFLVVMSGPDAPDSARTLVDPSEIDAEGTTSIDWFEPSPDGKFVAVSMSVGGTESGDVTVYDVATGKPVFEKVPQVNSGTAGGSLAWARDGRGFFYTKHFPVDPNDPEAYDVYQHVYFHQLGTPVESDGYELGKSFPEIAEIQLTADEHSPRLLATVQHGDGGEFAHHLRDADGTWRQFSDFGDGLKQAVFGPSDDLYLVTLEDAPRGKILRTSAAKIDLATAETIVPETEHAIMTGGDAFWGERTVLPTKSRLFVMYQLGGPSGLRVFDHAGKSLAAPELLPVSDVYDVVPLDGDAILYANSSFVRPKAYYHYDAATNATQITKLVSQSPVNFDDIEVTREMAVSKDGTEVPLTILARRGLKRNGQNRCLVTGYGGYGVSITPHFDPLSRILFDHDVMLVVANIRGGGEFGEPWHLAGNLTQKQNVFDDFAAVCRHVIDRKYTSSDRLAIEGGSNGGLLMGALFTQHPELAKCVVSQVGMYDMLRSELSPNGAFNVTEFGTVTEPDEFRAMYAYSPYHHVLDGTHYPAILFMTGENDPRVDPAESRKMTARLQAANGAKTPVLLRTSANSGHGGDNSLSEEIEQSVDVYAFLFDQLGVPTKAK
jgi:prolyl oligopeptidase